MPQYVPKPVAVIAYQVPDRDDGYEAAKLFDTLLDLTGGHSVPDLSSGGAIMLQVLDAGWRSVKPGEWIVMRGGKVLEVMGPEAFEAKYEAA